MHKVMDDGNGDNECHGSVPNRHSVSAILQLPRRLRQVSGKLDFSCASLTYVLSSHPDSIGAL